MQHQTVPADFNCVTRTSSLSGTNDDVQVSVTCNSGETMTSCGWSIASGGETSDGYDGAWQEDTNGVQTCWAQNGGGSGVYAQARCCDFSDLGDVECEGSEFGEYLNNVDDGIKTSTCPGSFPFLTGCTCQSNWRDFDGAYPGTDRPHRLVSYLDKTVFHNF